MQLTNLLEDYGKDNSLQMVMTTFATFRHCYICEFFQRDIILNNAVRRAYLRVLDFHTSLLKLF